MPNGAVVLRLNRHPGESIIITSGDNEIVVMIDSIDRGQVRLSIQAPPSVTIDRDEIHRKKLQGKKRDG